jgi:tetratricopeptide (TPR) repeat protein
LVTVGKGGEALQSFEKGLAICRRLYLIAPTPTSKTDLVDALGSLSWALLFNRRPQDALDRAEEAHSLDPSSLWIETNRAHALLFLGRFGEAKAIYQSDKDKILDNGKSFSKTVKEHFARLRKYGIDLAAMKDIEVLLSI